MMKTKDGPRRLSGYRSTGYVCAALLIVWACSTGRSLASEPAPTPAAAHFEVRFLEGMIDHHMMAVMMAELCEGRAIHADLLSQCETIIATQTAEIELMQSWLADWYGIAYEPQMTPGAMHQMERLAALTGEAFEIEFMQMMIRHHWKAVTEARLCEHRAYHEDLQAVCSEIIAVQSAEIALMQEWLCDWYGICNFGPKPQ